ncbi:MAG: NAD-dependent epimerase/dehydratase family protein, partial [Planctomycetes bacterium]|nr:NAD-dependent epimerase/dehydratase family protein [Planctomycetota bacterium]
IGRPDLLRSGYACAKALAECSAAAAAEEYGLRAIVVRLFNTVGPRQRSRYGMVLPTFVARALAGLPLTVFGDGSQTRCFAHVDEVVSAVLRLVDRGCFGRVFNVGSDAEWRIVDVAHRVVELVQSSSSIEFEPFEDAYPGFGAGVARRVPDLTALRTAIGFAPERALDDIIRDVLSRSSRVLPGLG